MDKTQQVQQAAEQAAALVQQWEQATADHKIDLVIATTFPSLKAVGIEYIVQWQAFVFAYMGRTFFVRHEGLGTAGFHETWMVYQDGILIKQIDPRDLAPDVQLMALLAVADPI
jgi:hypothetical protein